MTDKKIRVTLNTDSASKAAKDLDSDVQGIGRSADNAQFSMNKLAAAIGAVIAAGALRNIADMVQGYNAMAERVKMATSSTAEYELVQRRLMETANGTYRELAEAQELYILTQSSLRDLGYETEQVLDITDSLSYSFVRNATSQERARGAIDQLSKSIQKGKVEADSWASLLAATPSILEDIASATGKSTAEVSKLGATGKLSITDLTEGLRLARDANKELADGMEVNLTDAGVRVRNAMTQLFVQIEKGTGAIKSFTDSVVAAADELASMVSSGQLTQMWTTFRASLEPTVRDIIYLFSEIGVASSKLGEIIADDTNFFSDAFKNIIPNIRSFIQIATVELASFVDKSRAYGVALKDALVPFSGTSMSEARENLKAEIDLINRVRMDSIEGILAENDAAIKAQKEGYAEALRIRQEYNERMKALEGRSGSDFDPSGLKSPGSTGSDSKQQKTDTGNQKFIEGLSSTTSQLEAELERRRAISDIYRQAEIKSLGDYFEQERIMFEARTQEQIADIEARYTLEKEQREYQLQEALARDGLNYAEKLRIQYEYDEQKSISAQIAQEQITAIEETAARERINIAQREQQQKIQFWGDMASSGIAIMQAFGSKSEKQQKNFARMSIIADTAQGIARGVALGWPAGIPAVAWAVANGAMAMSRLNSPSGVGGGVSSAPSVSAPTQTASAPIQQQQGVFTLRIEGMDTIADDALISGRMMKEIFTGIKTLESDGYRMQ